MFDTDKRSNACIAPQGSRWHLAWRMKNNVGERTCEVKARLIVQGFGDRQRNSVITRNPTAARTAQRLLVSTCVPYGFELSSIGVSTAFLLGMNVTGIETATGKQRKACVKPPDDIWEFLPQEE